MQISDQEVGNSLKEKLLLINKKWKNMQDKFKQSENKTLLKLIECEQGVVNINEWINNINQLIERTSKCSVNALIRYQEELQKANTDLERIDANLNLISKLAGRIDINDKNKIDNLIREIKELEKKIKILRELIPEYCTNLTKLCSVITSAEDGLQETEHWVNEGETLLNSQPELLNFEQITKHIDKQKV
jgi:DNA repair exonuclease SbcCD ATPase subunit